MLAVQAIGYKLKSTPMRLIRYGLPGAERPGMLDAQGILRDLSMLLPDIGPAQLAPRTLAALAAIDATRLPAVQEPVRLACPVAGVGKIVCVGLNYRDHALEVAPAAAHRARAVHESGDRTQRPDDPLLIPPGATKTDWEVELGVVIGTRAQRIAEAQALQHVAGYVLANDVSERAWQMERGGQWDKGKGHDSFAPIGPWLVTTDELPDPHAIGLWLEVNGQRMQDGHTSQFIFGAAGAGLHQPVHASGAWRHRVDRHPGRCGPGLQAPAGVPEARRCGAPGSQRAG
jgi:2-keto-4-pentenoate hydratase/2-oxohepta-3-ene-1,7-dioic acid hydratase in catechol pathway